MASPALQRAILVAIALLAGAGIVQAGVAERLSRRDPAAAARFAPHDGRIAMAAARALIANDGATDPRVAALARVALARDPTQTGAIEVDAAQAQARGDRARAERLFELSSTISRRSLPTRLWLIQRSVDHGDVGGALRDFDVALRTSLAAPPVLFPVLADAATDPGLVQPIARLLDRPGDWRVPFLDHAVAQGDAHCIAAVLLAMRDHRVIADNGIAQTLIARAVGARDFALAAKLRAAFALSRVSGALLADANFSDSALPPFGWSLVERGDIGAERSDLGGRSTLAWRAEPGRGGQVAAQLVLLAPGRYRLATRTVSAGDEAPYWALACGEEGGAILATLDQPDRANAAGAVIFTVPAGCTGQWLTLTLRPGGGSGGQAGAIAGVAITRL